MPLSLKELIRRGDVCFFCGYHVGDTGRPVCPECGYQRPAPEMIARVQRAIRIGKVGIIVIALLIAALMLFLFSAMIWWKDPYAIVLVGLAVIGSVILAAMLSPWSHMVRHPHRLFTSYWRRTLVAIYPWCLMLAGPAFLFWNWLLNS